MSEYSELDRQESDAHELGFGDGSSPVWGFWQCGSVVVMVDLVPLSRVIFQLPCCFMPRIKRVAESS